MITRMRVAPPNLFGQELDDRSTYIALTVQGYSTMQLNMLEGANCPICTMPRVYVVAVTRKCQGGYMFRVCQDCGHTTRVFSSK